MKTQIIVPQNWSAVSLKKYMQLQKDLKVYEGDDEAQLATLFYHLCKLEPDTLFNLDTQTFLHIKDDLYSFIGNTECDLQQRIEINGVKYGFYPNLSKIEYGAYIDISKFGEMSLDRDWAKVMAILYRPITKEIGKLYEVASYTGNEDWEQFLEVPMDVHFGAWFFFINSLKDLAKGILNYTKEEEMPEHCRQILHKSGNLIQQL